MPVGDPPQSATIPAPTLTPVPTFQAPPSVLPVSDVTVIIGYKDRDGRRVEVIHDVNDVRITECTHSFTEKQKLAKDEDGHILGFEPTGEYVLKLTVKFNKG
jgi:hypothetical protein